MRRRASRWMCTGMSLRRCGRRRQTMWSSFTDRFRAHEIPHGDFCASAPVAPQGARRWRFYKSFLWKQRFHRNVHKVPSKPYVSRVSRLVKGQNKGQRAAKNPVTVEITGFSLAQKEGFELCRVCKMRKTACHAIIENSHFPALSVKYVQWL